MSFVEAERSYLVDHAKLPPQQLAKTPWVFLQGYWFDNGLEWSIRVVPACGVAQLRSKTQTLTGIRTKTRQPMEIGEGIAMLRRADKIACKERRIWPEIGRIWVVEHYLDGPGPKWVAETEFDPPSTLYDDFTKPKWLGADNTGDQMAYTRNHAIRRTQQEIDDLISLATRTGCKQEYSARLAKKQSWYSGNSRSFVHAR